jgi:ubiquinone biosynthesis protein UbiJ
VLRALRQLRRELRSTDRTAAEAVTAALHAVRTMDIPHLELEDETDEVVH